MSEPEERICIPFTHTYDQFTTFFYDGRVYLSDTSYPIGQCCVDIANMDEEVLSEIDRRVEALIPAARELLTEKTNNAAAFAQEKLNAVWDIIFTMPVYRDLNMDLELNYHLLERLVEIDFVPMMRKENEGECFVAEKTTFNYLHDFLRTEFYRGLAIGNAPRRCHNCGKYFLLTAGYNTCYCSNIAPGETARTCRKVGAHRKEAQGKANRSPARVEYDRTYNRLKQRKVRGKISVDEWNAAVAKAMQVLERAERGELADDEMRKRFREF